MPALLGAMLLASSCALPPRGAELTSGARRERYLAALDRRDASAAGLEASIALWLRTASGKRLPGVLGELELEAPDRFRITLHDPLGTALQAGGEGRHIVLLLPSRRASFASDDLGDSVGLARPSEFLVRSLTARWRPPGHAWPEADSAAGRAGLKWIESDQRVGLELDARARPVLVRVSTRRVPALRIGYSEWFRALGAEWPGRIEIADSSGAARLTCRIERLRRRAPHGQDGLAIAVPRGARPLDWPGLLRELTRREGS